jgi:hypothetical protein
MSASYRSTTGTCVDALTNLTGWEVEVVADLTASIAHPFHVE